MTRAAWLGRMYSVSSMSITMPPLYPRQSDVPASISARQTSLARLRTFSRPTAVASPRTRTSTLPRFRPFPSAFSTHGKTPTENSFCQSDPRTSGTHWPANPCAPTRCSPGYRYFMPPLSSTQPKNSKPRPGIEPGPLDSPGLPCGSGHEDRPASDCQVRAPHHHNHAASSCCQRASQMTRS